MEEAEAIGGGDKAVERVPLAEGVMVVVVGVDEEVVFCTVACSRCLRKPEEDISEKNLGVFRNKKKEK